MSQRPTYEELEDRIRILEQRLAGRADTGELRRVKALLEETQILGKMGSWEMNLLTGEVVWTANQYRILGYEPGEVKDLHLFFMEKVVHPLDRPRMEAAFQALTEDGKALSMEYRVIKKDGTERILFGEVVPQFNPDGQMIRVYGVNLDITDRRTAETSLGAEKELTENILLAMKDVFVLYDPESGKALRWNPAFTQTVGYSDREISRLDLIQTCIPEPDQEAAYEFLAGVLEKGYGTMAVRLLNKDGQAIDMEFSTSVVLDRVGGRQYIIAIGRDIRERKAAETALEESHQQFLTVLDSIDATVYVVDMKTYEILFVNQHMSQTFGRDMTGEICYKAYRGEASPCGHCPNDGLVDENGNPSGVCIWQTRNPLTDRWYMNYDRAVRWTDGRLVKLQIATDVTELKRMEAELRQAYKMESVGILAGGVAHDFNNILGIIIGNAELALDDLPQTSPVHDHLREIRTAGLRARDVVRQLLRFSRKSDVEQKPLDLVPVVAESLTLLRASIPSSVEIQTDFPAEAPAVMADATQIHQVVINLCTNAAHAMADAGGILRVSLSVVLVQGQAGPESFLELAIADTGPGMSSAVREKMFDPYFTTKAVGKGTGMGLSVVHGIVQHHGGHILVDSVPEQGTRVAVRLPLALAPAVAKTSPEAGLSEFGAREHILFVDDEPAIAKLVQRHLERLRYRVTALTSPVEALSVFKENPQGVDLVITDYTMPGMNGLALAGSVTALRPDIPVIICTGHDAGLDQIQMQAVGVRAVLIKPLSRADLSHEIRTVLGKSPDEVEPE